MMNKHTKGPWHFAADARENGFERTEVPFDYRGSGFCGNPTIYGADGEEVVGCDEYYVFRNEADVRLICAAPDLLEALQELFADYKSLADSGDAGFWSLEDQDVGKKAIAAINKATGVNDE
jgi:hypothetical protein